MLCAQCGEDNTLGRNRCVQCHALLLDIVDESNTDTSQANVDKLSSQFTSQLLDNHTSLLACIAFAGSILVLLEQAIAIPSSVATPMALQKACEAYRWGKWGWGCSILPSLIVNPIPSLIAFPVSIIAAMWLFRENLSSIKSAAISVYIIIATLVVQGQLVGYVFTGLARPTYLLSLVIWVLPIGWWYFRTALSMRAYRKIDKQRKKRADAAMMLEIQERLRESREA